MPSQIPPPQASPVGPPMKTVLSVAPVQWALVEYADPQGQKYQQLALVGQHNIVLFDNREIGFGAERTPAGFASPWLKDQIMAKYHEAVAALVARFRGRAAVAVATNDPREMAWGDARIDLAL